MADIRWYTVLNEADQNLIEVVVIEVEVIHVVDSSVKIDHDNIFNEVFWESRQWRIEEQWFDEPHGNKV